MKARHLLPLFTALLGIGIGLAACNPEQPNPNADTYAQGQAQNKDAATDHQGNAQEPSKPDPQPVTIEINVAGSGNLSGLKPECSLEGASGKFTGLLSGEGSIDENGGYFAGLASTEGEYKTPSGSCQIPNVSANSLTSVSVKAKLENTTRNCKNYCESKARSSAEAQCGSGAGQASCRSSAETSYSVTCEQKCSGTTTRRIVAETSLTLTQLAELNAHQLGASGFGTLNVDLTFEKIEDESTGQPVSEQ